MSIEFIVNIVVICLLVPTIIFAIILNKRLDVLRNSRADLGRLIDAFNDATTRAESGIPRLKQAADSAGSLLRDQIQRSQTLRDDMAFMIERAELCISKLENASRNIPSQPSVKQPAFSPSGLAARIEEEPVVSSPSTPLSSKPKKRRVLAESPEDLISSAVMAAEGILRDNSDVSMPKHKMPMGLQDDVVSDRSEAERELLKALQSMR